MRKQREYKHAQHATQAGQNKALDNLFKGLDAPKRTKLQKLCEKLREQWDDSEAKTTALRQSRDQLAGTLYEIRTLLVKDGLFSKLLDAYGIPRQTAYDLIDDHERIVALELTPAARRAAESAHLDLTAKRLASVLERFQPKLKAADTTEKANKVVTSIIAAGKRRSKPKIYNIAEHREVRYDILVRSARAFFQSLAKDKADLTSKLQDFVNKIVPGATVTLPQPKIKEVA